MVDFVLILPGEIMSWSLLEVKGLTLKSDWHLISPYSITLASNVKVMRIKEMITNSRYS